MAAIKKYVCKSILEDYIEISSFYSDDDLVIETTTHQGNAYVYLSKENAIDLANSILEHYKNQNNE
jgi:hypothetical protein